MNQNRSPKHIEYNLKLDLINLNSETLNKWYTLDVDKSLTIKEYHKIPSHLLTEYCKVLSTIENSMPDEPGNPEVIVDENEVLQERDILSFVLFKDATIVGISRIFLSPEDPTTLYQGQIGIVDKYRGFGLGKLLLGTSHKYLFDSYKELTKITVDTHPSNSIMISLLEKLGYIYTHTQLIY